jgi:hypothetical protein
MTGCPRSQPNWSLAASAQIVREIAQWKPLIQVIAERK